MFSVFISMLYWSNKENNSEKSTKAGNLIEKNQSQSLKNPYGFLQIDIYV